MKSHRATATLKRDIGPHLKRGDTVVLDVFRLLHFTLRCPTKNCQATRSRHGFTDTSIGLCPEHDFVIS